MILLDTNVVSELMRPTPNAKVHAWLTRLGSAPVATSVITIAEITYGLARLPDGKRRTDLTDRFKALIAGDPPIPVYAFDVRAAHLAGGFRAVRERAGLAHAPSDMMIAGIAVSNGARLATRNVTDFSNLPVTVENPWA
jgi:predicted nucleic acid-binding protein